MALKVDKNRTYVRKVVDEEDGTEYTVTFRKLDYGDIQQRREVAIKRRKNARKKGRKAARDQFEFDARAVDNFTLTAAIVEWEFPFEKTDENIAELDPDIVRQCMDHIEDINPYILRERGELDEEEDDEEENGGDEEDASEPALHAVEGESQQVFGEEEGPTRTAATS
jgi:hypothetical protein